MNKIDFNFFKDKIILVTGDAGFKGSWLVASLLKIGCKKIIGVGITKEQDLLSSKIRKYFNNDVYVRYETDILNKKKLNEIFNLYKPEIIFHLAAQALVIDGYEHPFATYNSNFIGTLNVIESAYTFGAKIILNITTDKVYKHISKQSGYDENDVLDGYDPYSCSKACVEMMSRSFYNSFLEKKNITLINLRSGNVIGGGDLNKNRIFTDIYNAITEKKALNIRNPKSIRPYQHVMESIFAYITLAEIFFKKDSVFESFNISPNSKDIIDTEKLVEISRIYFGDDIDINYSKSEYHETDILILNNNKIKTILNYFPILNINKSIELTVNGYKSFYGDKIFWDLINNQIEDYINEIKKHCN